MSLSSNFPTTFIEGALEAFTNIIVPITALSYTATNQLFNPGDTVLVPYCQNTSASAAFGYATGYNQSTNLINVKSVVLNNLVYQKFQFTDADLAKLNPEAVLKMAAQAGEALANDVISSSLSATVTNANFPTSASCVYTSLTSSAAISDLVTQCDNAKFPVSNRILLLNPTAYNVLLKNTTLASATSYGGSQVVQDGGATPLKVQGFNVYKTTVTLPNSCNGLVLNSNAILTAFGVHKVNTTLATQVQYSVGSDKNGITIGLRQWYDPSYATSNYTLECLSGVGVGNPSALFQMK